MKHLHLLSDLHLEYYPKNLPKLTFNSNYLFLCGDIGHPTRRNYLNFFSYVSDKYEKVFYVTGNHEYYKQSTHKNYSMNEIDMIIKDKLAKFSNVYFLNNDSHQLNSSTTIIGTTLWSDVDTGSSRVSLGVNDYHKIYKKVNNEHQLILPTDIRDLHFNNRNFLKETIEKNRMKDIIIMTHHLPSYSCILEKYKKYAHISSCFASNCDDFMFNYPNIKYWFFGHTHSFINHRINNTILYANPLGYKDSGYREDFRLLA